MNLLINGKQKEFSQDTTVDEVISTLGIIPETIVVELNQSLLQPEAYGERRLKEGDKLELIRFVGGG